MKGLIILILIGVILITPVLAETGSISVLADPSYFTATEKVKSEIIGTMADENEIRDIHPFGYGLKEIIQIFPISGKDYPGGFSAQNVQQVIPSIVYENPNLMKYVDIGNRYGGMEYTAPSGTYTLSINTNGIIAALVNAVKELKSENDNQQGQIDNLTKRIETLEMKARL